MLFDLRVVLAACLATFLFAAIGLGLLASSRAPFKASAGYAQNDGRGGLAGPGLPKGRPLPLPETPEPETTGAIAEAPEAPPEPSPPAPAKAAKAAKTAPPAAKKQSITSLIEEDKAQQENAAKEAAKKAAAVKKKPRHVRHRPKQPPKQTNPWSVFTNNNNTATTR